jgi:hypothetical protein
MGRRWDQGFPNRASGSTGTPSNWQHWHHTLHGCTGSSTGKPDQLVRYENRKLCYMGQKAKHVFGSATGRPWHLISSVNAGITRYDGGTIPWNLLWYKERPSTPEKSHLPSSPRLAVRHPLLEMEAFQGQTIRGLGVELGVQWVRSLSHVKANRASLHRQLRMPVPLALALPLPEVVLTLCPRIPHPLLVPFL